MSETRRVGDLEIGQDLGFQRRQWAIQRVAWVVMALVVVAGLLGLLGEGPLSRASAEAGPVEVEYPRFERKRSPMELRVTVAGGTAEQGRVQLWLDQDFLDRVQIERVSPEPEQVLAGADRTTYVFLVDEPSHPAILTFALEHDTFGAPTASLGLVGGPAVEFTQIIYP